MIESLASDSAEETEAFGAQIASRMAGSGVLLLTGQLGAGKTTAVRGIARGCGVAAESVHSPSFSLVNHYTGERSLIHVDLYRLEKESDLYSIGLDYLLDEDALTVVEWATRLPWKIPSAWRLHIRVTGENSRLLRLETPTGLPG